jgi:hypothetical protein
MTGTPPQDRRTDEFVKFFLSRYASPLEVLAQAVSPAGELTPLNTSLEIKLLRSIAYKAQCPENAGKQPHEWGLTDDEKAAMRRAVTDNI